MENKEKSLEKLKEIIETFNNEKIINDNDSEILECLQNLINCKIKTVKMPSFFINEEGEVVDTGFDNDISKDLKFMTISHRNIKCVNDFSFIKSYPFIYIFKIKIHNDYIQLSLAEYVISKKKVTFTISQNIMDEFDVVADRLAINKSKFVENKMKELISSVSS